ncbi:MAG TPA: copper resistance protein CopC [Solirubrobacteraceae bacterium]|nr:copper resistance protein CopC [Solirubrobacteraceae bacterium]
MTRAGRILGALVAVVLCLAVMPEVASAHAYLIRTSPTASRVLNTPPRQVSLTYDEAVEPRFAIISVTNVDGHQETTGPVRRSAADPDTLVVPLRPRLPEGWYLIYWRAISVDGHPVQGAFTYAVGPNPGPAPKFAVPSISAGATAPNLLITRWVMFLSVMVAIGLFALRFFVARSLPRRVDGTGLRALSVAFVAASVIGVLAIPVYLDFAIASDSLRSVFDVGALVPLFRVTAFGRGYVDMMLCFALFCVAAWVALLVDRPDRRSRSLAEILAQTGALLAAGAVLVLPGAVGHAGQTSPRGLSVPVDWLHLIAGSVWLGGLVGLLVLWFTADSRRRVAALSVVVPRFSTVALGSVALLLTTGTIATIDHMPALDALWDTGYGVAILVKIAILLVAMAVAAGNLLSTRPRLAAAGGGSSAGDGADAVRAASLLRRLVAVEAVLVAGAVFVAALLSSLAPPPPAFAKQNAALASVGPGTVAQTIERAGYRLQVLVSPNKAAAPDSFALRITKGGQPVRHADVTLTFNHTEMQMPQQQYQLTETRPGVYSRRAPALIMVGKWALAFNVSPPGGPPFTALIIDEANG